MESWSLGENTENHKTFSVPIEKEIQKIDKDGNEYITVSYKIKFIGLWQFHYQILSIISQKEFVKLNAKVAIVFLNTRVNDNLIKYKCLSCNKNYSNKINEKLKKRFQNTLNFSNNDINKLILLLRKGVYLYEYMDERKKFHETLLPRKDNF